MVFIVGVTYDLGSTLELKSKGLPCVDMFLKSDLLLLLSWLLYIILLKISKYKPDLYNMERLILFPSIWSTMVKTTSIASQDISMQSKCLVNQKKKIDRKQVVYNIIQTISLRTELFYLVILKQIQELV